MVSVENAWGVINNFSDPNRKSIKYVFFSTFSVGIGCYFLLMIYGYTCPDGLIEGLYYYVNADWALANGRWATRYLNFLVGHNVVIPFIVVLLYCFVIALAVIIISRLFRINKATHLILISAIMIASPSIIAQLTYTYMALAYGMAFLCSVLYCYLTRKGIGYSIIGVICLTVAMGLYQSYLGAAVLLIILVSVYDLFLGKSIKSCVLQLIKYGITGISACILDIIEYKSEIYLRKVHEASRSASFSLKLILSSLGTSLRNSYDWFGEYFTDHMLRRNILYILLAVCVVIVLLDLFLIEFRRKHFTEIFLIMLFLVAVPPAANVIGILVPYHPVGLLMRYHYVLVIPFIFALLELVHNDALKIVTEWIISMSVFILIYTYALSANASFMCWKISYNIMSNQTTMILSDIFELEEYHMNKTKILFAGFPNDHTSRSKLGIYQYAIGLTNNVAYWDGWNGVSNSRYHYLLDYYGIDAGFFSQDEYLKIIESVEFDSMPIWPRSGSVKMLKDIVVVKLTEIPPLKDK